MKKTNIVVIGGGTSTATILSGLKAEPSFALSAIVPVTDSGGSSGAFVQAFSRQRARGESVPAIVPPGDVANALMALSRHEPALHELFNYRFSRLDTPFRGHSLRNLVVDAAMELWGTRGMPRLTEIFAADGGIFPASTEALRLIASLEDGREIGGEEAIDHLSYEPTERHSIIDVRIEAYGDSLPSIDPGARQAIQGADVILFASSDLWTSTIPILLVPGMTDALSSSQAHRCYLIPLTAKRLNTEGYDARRFVHTLERYAFPGLIHTLLHNTAPLPANLLGDATGPVPFDETTNGKLRVIAQDLLDMRAVEPVPGDIPRSIIRHDPEKVRTVVASLVRCLS